MSGGHKSLSEEKAQKAPGKHKRAPDPATATPDPLLDVVDRLGNRGTLDALDFLGMEPEADDPKAVLSGYNGLRHALPVDFAVLARAAEAGETAEVVTPLWTLLPPGLECVPREDLVPHLAEALGTVDGPSANANGLASLIAGNESTRRFLFDKLDAEVTIAVVEDPGTGWPILRFSVGGILLSDRDGLLPLDSLDRMSIVTLNVIVEQEGRAAAQLVDLDVAQKHVDFASGPLSDLADQRAAAPWKFPFQEFQQLHTALSDLPGRIEKLQQSLVPSNADQASRVASMLTRAKAAAQKGQAAMQRGLEDRNAHMPSESAGEIYEEAEEEGWEEGGWGYLSWFSSKLWHTAGDITTLGSISMQGHNNKLYRQGLISRDDYVENQYWNFGKSLVVGVVTAFTAGWGGEAAAGWFASAGYTAEGSAILTGTTVGMGTGFTTSVASDAYSFLVAHGSSSPGVQLEQRQAVGGPASWATNTMVGGMLGGTFSAAGSRLRFQGIPNTPLTESMVEEAVPVEKRPMEPPASSKPAGEVEPIEGAPAAEHAPAPRVAENHPEGLPQQQPATKSLDDRIAEAEAKLNPARQKTVDYQAQRQAQARSLKGGPKKGIDNIKEEIWLLKRQKAYPNRQLLEKTSIVGVKTPDGKLTPTSDIASVGRQPDFVEINGNKVIGGELKSSSEIKGSIKGGLQESTSVQGEFRPKSKLGGQWQVEDAIVDAARATGGKLVIRGYDVETGKLITKDVAPDDFIKGLYSYESEYTH
jgi:hypothetical protein